MDDATEEEKKHEGEFVSGTRVVSVCVTVSYELCICGQCFFFLGYFMINTTPRCLQYNWSLSQKFQICITLNRYLGT